MLATSISPRFLETDALGHINNTVLPMWFEAAREPVFRMFSPELDLKDWKLMLGKFSVTFHAETHYGSEVEIKTYISRIGGASFDVYQECWQNGTKTVSGLTTMINFCHQEKKSQPLPQHIIDLMKEHFIELAQS
ncbi:MAG: acyl-CoA thioesterase [Gammaproteobacteria bacterium]|nr:acyl-CoA thioesterase [Gammaproteobacteria bacterium]